MAFSLERDWRGIKAKDRLTGFEGIITARIQHWTRCDVYLIQPNKLNEKGEVVDAQPFDVTRIEVISEEPLALYSPVASAEDEEQADAVVAQRPG